MENVWHKGWDLCRFLRCQLARDCDFGSRKGTCSSAHILLDTHGRVRKEWNLQKRSQAPIKLFVQVHGTRVKSTQSVLSRLVSVCPCCFAFVGGLFSTSMIFISSTPSLCAMKMCHLACFGSAITFTWRLVQTRVVQTSREVARDSRRATSRACDIRLVLNSKRYMNYFQ